MFHDIPKPILERMRHLEALDAVDRTNGTPRLKRLRQITPETGQFIAMLAASAPAGEYVEIGTSSGYSTMWLALACRAVGRSITTYEVLPEKAKLAEETFRVTGVTDVVRLVKGDARQFLGKVEGISFCFLDAEKEIYGECYELVVPKLKKGGLLVADNAINHREVLAPMLDRALNDTQVDAMIVPVGKGELVCRKL
jgi:predicted O-methyltransferase YrrM